MSRTKKPYSPEQRRAAYLANKEEALAYQRQWTAANPIMRMAHNANTRAISLDISGRLTAADVEAVFRASSRQCSYCGAPADTIDHVVPLSRGGSNTRENLVACCRKCNLSKRAMLVSEWNAKGARDAAASQRRLDRVETALSQVAK